MKMDKSHQPWMVKNLPEAHAMPDTINSQNLTPTIDDVKTTRSQLTAGFQEDDQSSVYADGSFPRSSIDDILPADGGSNEDLSAEVAAYLSDKIAAEARDAYFDAQRLGDTRGSMDVVEKALHKLTKISLRDPGKSGIAARIEMLGALERHDEAKTLFGDLRTVVQAQGLPERPRQATARTSGSSKRQKTAFQDAAYESEYQRAHLKMLDSATWSQDYPAAANEMHRLGLDIAFFENYDFRDPEKRFEMIRGLLNVGLQYEHRGYEAQDSSAYTHLTEALKIYSQGCELMEIHQKHIERPDSHLTFHDHADCSNLFFSATRVCLKFHERDYDVLPVDFPCTPRLTELNWRRQALYFLERGKTRALLRSVERCSEGAIPSRRKMTLRDLAREALDMVASRRHNSLQGSQLDSDSPMLSSSSRDAVLEGLRVRYSWRRVLLDVRALNEGHGPRWAKMRINEMLKHVPEDTAIIEYGLVTGKRPGLLSFLITSTDICPRWEELRTIRPILNNIARLKELIEPTRQGLRKPKRPGSSDEDVENSSRVVGELSDALLASFNWAVLTKKRFFIVPSGDLAHLPWGFLLQSLRTSDENPSVSLIPSFRIWYGLENRARSPSSESAKATIICNSPRYPNGMDRDIKFSRIEALYIARRHNTWPILADQNDLEDFEREGKQSNIIHLSSHGTFNEEFPILANVDVFHEPMTVLDVSRMALRPDIVIFSSCLSAHSRVFDSGTALSFAHALLGSGACAFVGTLWITGDIPSLVFMVLFYQAMMEKRLTPSGALAEAQHRMKAFTEADKLEVVGLLLELFTSEVKRSGRSTIEKYVINYRYWIDLHLRNYPTEELRSPGSWAGFVLIGHGESVIYPPASSVRNIS
ncbi:hypothetical protein F5Y15DRAFT_292835 [Xylariaceae sp. FL0016]|nr:hypothetical protein F5Y15DRAFT_292835 [Xylariaceae sp. FL0016]